MIVIKRKTIKFGSDFRIASAKNLKSRHQYEGQTEGADERSQIPFDRNRLRLKLHQSSPDDPTRGRLSVPGIVVNCDRWQGETG